MGRASRTRAAYRISQRLIPVYTAPEKVIQEIIEELGRELGFKAEMNVPMRVWDGEETWVLQIDHFLHSPKWDKQICLHTDGKYHDTKRMERKDRWKDALLKANNLRSYHVDAGLTTNKKYKAYIKDRLYTAISKNWEVLRVDA